MRLPAIDRCPQGDPETVVYLPTGSLLGLHIRGVEGHVMLGIREDAEGFPVSMAVVTELHIVHEPPHSSNPRRHTDSDLRKGAVED